MGVRLLTGECGKKGGQDGAWREASLPAVQRAGAALPRSSGIGVRPQAQHRQHTQSTCMHLCALPCNCLGNRNEERQERINAVGAVHSMALNKDRSCPAYLNRPSSQSLKRALTCSKPSGVGRVQLSSKPAMMPTATRKVNHFISL